MSVADLFEMQAHLRTWERADTARAWVLHANPVWGSAETVNNIVLFDTREQAEAYQKASQLPEELRKRTEDGIYRTHRPDSLLYDYNIDLRFDDPMIIPAVPWVLYEDVTQNPEPPSGEVEGWPQLTVGRYGKDFDVGMGGHHSNMDHVVPEDPKKPEEPDAEV